MKEELKVAAIFILGVFLGSFITYQIDMDYINNTQNFTNIIEENIIENTIDMLPFTA